TKAEDYGVGGVSAGYRKRDVREEENEGVLIDQGDGFWRFFQFDRRVRFAYPSWGEGAAHAALCLIRDMVLSFFLF
ncbi:hypothetical protein, partial [Cronobacter sakazakii]|uniref:hypothetical protein n=1 Tax=Cronobacter sakazakii TaxID=28141 RepID=UPI000D515900